MSEELRPCPFCGGTKICTEKGINLNYCDNCSAESNVEHWNNRPIEDALNARIAELEAEIDKDVDLTIVGLRKELLNAQSRIAELETKIRHNALWQASEDAEERAHLEKLVPDLKKRIAELEGLVDELVNIGDNLFDSLNPIAWKHEWLDKWWKLSSCRRGERE